MLVVLSGSSNTVRAAVFDECKKHFRDADADGNGILSLTEWDDAIQRITYGAVSALSTASTASLLPSNTLILSNTVAVETACTNLYPELVKAMDLPIPDGIVQTSQCFLYMTIGDMNRNGVLERTTEYTRYLTVWSQKLQLSNTVQSTTFDALVEPLRNVLDEFVSSSIGSNTGGGGGGGGDGGIDVTGTRPGTQPTSDRLPVLTALCQRTVVALAVADHLVRTTPTISPPSQSPPTTPSDEVDGIDLRLCQAIMLSSDRDRNALLDDTEYVRFVSTMARRVIPSSTTSTSATTAIDPEASYNTLPQGLQTIFATYATNVGAITIIRPGDTTATANQQTQTQAMCDNTAKALIEWTKSMRNDEDDDPQSTDTDDGETSSQVPPPIVAYPYTQCTLSMATADRDRSNVLDESEYVSFLNKVQSNTWRDVTYDDLPTVLRDNYDELAMASNFGGGTTGIDISGSMPSSSPTLEQRTFLERICLETAVAVHAALYPTTDNKNNDDDDDDDDDDNNNNNTTTTNATPFTGNVTLYTAFVITTTDTATTLNNSIIDTMTTDTDSNSSNRSETTMDINDDGNNISSSSSSSSSTSLSDVLNRSGTEEALRVAYQRFVGQKVALYRGTGDYRVIDGTMTLYSSRNYTMADGCVDCRIVYGRFELEVQRYVGHVEWVVGNVTSMLQAGANATKEAGSLESFLIDAFAPDPSPLTIVGIPPDGHVRPASDGMENDTLSDPDDDDEGGIGIGLVVGIVLIILVCCVGSGAMWYYSDDVPGKIMTVIRGKKESSPAPNEDGSLMNKEDNDDGYRGPKFTGAPAGYDDDDDDDGAGPPPPARKPRRASIFMHGHPDDSEQGGDDDMNNDFDITMDGPGQPVTDDNSNGGPFPRRVTSRKMSYGGESENDDDDDSASGSGYGDSDSYDSGSYNSDYE